MKCPEHPDMELQKVKTDDGRNKFVLVCPIKGCVANANKNSYFGEI